MVCLSRTSEELIAEIQELHSDVEFNQKVNGEMLRDLLVVAQEVWVRQEIAAGLTAVATPGWDYLAGWNDREGRTDGDEYPVVPYDKGYNDGYEVGYRDGACCEGEINGKE